MRTNSILSQKREIQRNSAKTQEFKTKVIELLRKAKPEVAYAIKRDLSVMTNMPFYKDRPERLRKKISHIDLIIEYAQLFITCPDTNFIKDLIKKLGVQQNQTLRKAAPKFGTKSFVWEHAIPVKIVIHELIEMVLNKDLTNLRKLLEIYERAGQRGLTMEQNELLKDFNHSMPPDWDWRGENVDPLARHTYVGIRHHS